MLQCVPYCSTSTVLIRIVRICSTKRFYTPMFTETTATQLAKTKDSEVQKRKDPTMLEEVDVRNLPRAERRHVEEFLKMSERKAIAMKRLSYKNLATFMVLFCSAVGIYVYTFHGLKQETFLEEIDEEVAAEQQHLVEKQN